MKWPFGFNMRLISFNDFISQPPVSLTCSSTPQLIIKSKLFSSKGRDTGFSNDPLTNCIWSWFSSFESIKLNADTLNPFLYNPMDK